MDALARDDRLVARLGQSPSIAYSVRMTPDSVSAAVKVSVTGSRCQSVSTPLTVVVRRGRVAGTVTVKGASETSLPVKERAVTRTTTWLLAGPVTVQS